MIPSTPSLLDLLALFERAGTLQAVREGSPQRGIPGWAMRTPWQDSKDDGDGWFDRVGDVALIHVGTDNGHVTVEIAEEDTGAPYYRCPVTFRRRELSTRQVGLYAVREQPLLHHLADLLGIPQAQRAGIASANVDGLLWRLGKARVGPVHTDIWVTRNLHENLDEIFRCLEDPRHPEQGIVLTASAGLPIRVARPRKYCFVPLTEVVGEFAGAITMDTDLMYRYMTLPAGTDHEPSLPVSYDAVAGVLKISGKEPWHLKGEKQRGVVYYLFEALRNGRGAIKASELLNAVGCGGDRHGGSRRLSDIFNGNPVWKRYVHTPVRGMYAFKLE